MCTLSTEVPVINLHEVGSHYRQAAGRFRAAAEQLELAVTALEGRRWRSAEAAATAYGPYDIDVARALGQEVDVSLDANSYAVTNAGPDWREVYETLCN